MDYQRLSLSDQINNRNRSIYILIFLLLLIHLAIKPTIIVDAAQDNTPYRHLVEPGDTWLALSLRFGVERDLLMGANQILNPQRQPAIGRIVTVPTDSNTEINGRLVTLNKGGMFQVAAISGRSPWLLALSNRRKHPFKPLLFKSVLIPDDKIQIRELPVGIDSLVVSTLTARPGIALAINASGPVATKLQAYLDGQSIQSFVVEDQVISLFGTGAFFPPGEHLLIYFIPGEPMWSQPWYFEEGQWAYDNITLTGSAAAIDQASIEEERERLLDIWSEVSDEPLWQNSFQFPIENYLSVSSEYGARRSYNGGAYNTYHEGLDFSAYGGTPVVAPAAGTVVLAEQLYVRGGAVIINHGLGIFTGLYHLDEVHVEEGQSVIEKQLVGKVGSTGLSTGNHLHWDLLVGGIWVDPQTWLDTDLAGWINKRWVRK